MLEKKYYMDRKVKMVEDTEKRTPNGAVVQKISFDVGEPVLMSHKRFDLLQSPKQSDATATRDKLIGYLSAMIYGILHEYSVRFGEVSPILDAVVNLANAGSNKATNLMWGVEHFDDRDLLVINDILIKNHRVTKAEPDNGVTPSGSQPDQTDQK